ncbi:unnamed protein product [Cercopithifilaria johnstoni]|uniref:Uncharacterized protein n=1 Tax=Cercopithifilaria johnstoni TaxID=2874296 RepID=A0A8J2PSJ5_9BILA|nr:unnamed protein product [Cercopithifilaria johnstoni]
MKSTSAKPIERFGILQGSSFDSIVVANTANTDKQDSDSDVHGLSIFDIVDDDQYKMEPTMINAVVTNGMYATNGALDYPSVGSRLAMTSTLFPVYSKGRE